MNINVRLLLLVNISYANPHKNAPTCILAISFYNVYNAWVQINIKWHSENNVADSNDGIRIDIIFAGCYKLLKALFNDVEARFEIMLNFDVCVDSDVQMDQ